MGESADNFRTQSPSLLTPSAPAGDMPRWYVRGLWLCVLVDLAKHALLMLGGPLQPWPDSESYWQLGADAAQGDWWQVGSGLAFRTPVYPWFLAAFQWLCGRYALLGVVICQHVLELAASWLTASTVLQISRSRTAALVAYGFCALLTARSLFANTILTESVAVLLVALLVWIITRPAFAQNNFLVISGAFTLGIAILERPAAVAFLPALAWSATMFTSNVATVQRRCQRLGLVMGITALVLLPWCLRNAIVWNRFTISVFLGRELWTANFSPWPGAHFVVPSTGPGQELREILEGHPVNLQNNWSVASALSHQGLDDAELDDLMQKAAIQAIRENPRQATLHFLARCLTFWYVKDWELTETDYPSQAAWKTQASWSNAECRHWLRRILSGTPERFFQPLWGWSAITWLGVWGMWQYRPTRHDSITLACLLLGLTVLTAALEIPCYRYRCIIEPVMVIVTVSGTVSFVRGWQNSPASSCLVETAS